MSDKLKYWLGQYSTIIGVIIILGAFVASFWQPEYVYKIVGGAIAATGAVLVLIDEKKGEGVIDMLKRVTGIIKGEGGD